MRDGALHPVEFCRFEADLYSEPAVFVSDLHKDALRVIDLLEFLHAKMKMDARQWVFVSLGDMAGTPRFGEDGDPTEGRSATGTTNTSPCRNIGLLLKSV